jgi:hypothetical protein
MGLLRRWLNGEFISIDQEDEEHCVPVRVDGATKMITREEYERDYSKRT